MEKIEQYLSNFHKEIQSIRQDRTDLASSVEKIVKMVLDNAMNFLITGKSNHIIYSYATRKNTSIGVVKTHVSEAIKSVEVLLGMEVSLGSFEWLNFQIQNPKKEVEPRLFGGHIYRFNLVPDLNQKNVNQVIEKAKEIHQNAKLKTYIDHKKSIQTKSKTL